MIMIQLALLHLITTKLQLTNSHIIQQLEYECKLAQRRIPYHTRALECFTNFIAAANFPNHALRNLHWLALAGTPSAMQGQHAPVHLENLTAGRITAEKSDTQKPDTQ